MREICNARFLDGSFSLADCWKLYDYKLTLNEIDDLRHVQSHLDNVRYTDFADNEDDFGLNLKALNAGEKLIFEASRVSELINSTIDMVWTSYIL